MIQYLAEYDSPLGKIKIYSDGENITALETEKYRYGIGASKLTLKNNVSLEIFADTMAWLDRYFSGEKPEPSELSLAPAGGEFRQRVWELLLEIPYGAVVTYGDIARKIAAERGVSRMSAQAVGNAVGHNPIAIIIPCHRVVGATGSLTGYGGGIQTKVKLLELEGVDMSGLYVPTKGTAL